MNNQASTDKLLKSYHAMLDHVKELWHNAEEKAVPTLSENIESAAEKLSALGEMTKEEIDKISSYIERDLNDAGNHLSEYFAENGHQLENWIKNELEFAETKFAEVFATLADKTRIELDAIADRAQQVGVWHTGEITNVGVLYCQNCNEALYFKKPAHIPPCQKCKGTEFKKIFDQSG